MQFVLASGGLNPQLDPPSVLFKSQNLHLEADIDQSSGRDSVQ